MYKTLSLCVLVLSCVTAFPVLFLTTEEGDDGEHTKRLLDCVSPIPFLNAEEYGLTYRCRPSKKTVESLGLKASDLTVLEIVDEHENDITVVEIEEDIIIPEGPRREALFQASGVVLNLEEDRDSEESKYDVFPESRTRGKKQGGCADDEVFVAELDICMPFAPHAVKPQTATINEDKAKVPVINPDFKIIRVGTFAKPKCPEGEIYNPSIGICIPINNCWPHKDCSQINKDKDKDSKNKNSQDKRAGGEEDD